MDYDFVQFMDDRLVLISMYTHQYRRDQLFYPGVPIGFLLVNSLFESNPKFVRNL